VRLLSWNLFGLSDEHLDLRTEAALFTALMGGPLEQILASGQPAPPPPDVLMFQEVVDRTWHAHLRPHLSAAGYEIVPASPRPREYFEVLAVRPPFKVLSHDITPLDSFQARELTSVTASGYGHTWLFMTAHLESLKSGAASRHIQATQVLKRLRGHDGPAIFAGDTNLRMREADVLAPLPDAWEATGAKKAERFTWSKPKASIQARYDRIWGHNLRFSDFRCLGRQPVTPDKQPPSDHLGVSVTAVPNS